MSVTGTFCFYAKEFENFENIFHNFSMSFRILGKIQQKCFNRIFLPHE